MATLRQDGAISIDEVRAQSAYFAYASRLRAEEGGVDPEIDAERFARSYVDFETIRTWDDENRTAWCDKEAEQKAAEGGERVRKEKAEKERKDKEKEKENEEKAGEGSGQGKEQEKGEEDKGKEQ